MLKSVKYIVIAGIAIVITIIVYRFYHLKWAEERSEQAYNLTLQQIKGVTKLVVWEQDFLLNDIETQEKKYLGIFTTQEKVATSVPGKMGFHIDLSDSINTKITKIADTIYIKAPLQITYVSMELSKINQIKEASIDPTLEVNKEAIIKRLDKKALEKYLPTIIQSLQHKPLTNQEYQLSKLTGKPVKLSISAMPQIKDWEQR